MVGTGYVGIISGICFAEFGFETVCVDKDKSRLNIIRDGKILQKVYPKYLIVNNKLGPTGQPRGTLDNSKLFKTFNVRLKFKSYEETIRDYYGKYENLCTQ